MSISPAWADDVVDQINEALTAYNKKDVATAMDIDRGEQRQVASAFEALETAALI